MLPLEILLHLDLSIGHIHIAALDPSYNTVSEGLEQNEVQHLVSEKLPRLATHQSLWSTLKPQSSEGRH